MKWPRRWASTAERLRDALREEFDIDERVDARTERFFIRGSLRRVYTRPNAAEVAAFRTKATAPLESRLAKVKSALDDRERVRLAADLDALVRLQRSHITAGPLLDATPEAIGVVQGANLAGS